jgi:VanZ family protein
MNGGRLLRWAGVWLPALAWMGAIFFLSAQPQLPGLSTRWLDNLIKSGGHFAGYAVLAGLYWRIARRGPWPVRTALGVAFGGALLYALSDEFHQSLVPGRDPSLVDVVVDAAGAATGLTLVVVGRRLGPLSHRQPQGACNPDGSSAAQATHESIFDL